MIRTYDPFVSLPHPKEAQNKPRLPSPERGGQVWEDPQFTAMKKAQETARNRKKRGK